MCCCFLDNNTYFLSVFPNVHEAFHLLAAPIGLILLLFSLSQRCPTMQSVTNTQEPASFFFFYILLQPCYNTLPASPNTVETSEAHPSHHLTEMHRLHICSPFMEELSKVTLHAETQTRLIYFLNLWQLAQEGKFHSTLISRRLNKQRQSFRFLLAFTQGRLLEVIWQSRRIPCPD